MDRIIKFFNDPFIDYFIRKRPEEEMDKRLDHALKRFRITGNNLTTHTQHFTVPSFGTEKQLYTF
jgi:hypothetical protein